MAESSTTSTVQGAREHARAQADGQGTGSRVTVPAAAAADLPTGVVAGDVLWEESLAAGGYASRIVPRGSRIRFTDREGDTNLNLVLHHASRPIERLNVADTMKLQWNAYPVAGMLLLSDMGRVLGTILEGSTGAIDVLCGASTPAAVRSRYGSSGALSTTPAGRDRLLLGLAKHGLTRRDLPPAANLFTTVRVEPDGRLAQAAADPDGATARAGAHVTLRAEMDLLVTVAVTPHPLDDRSTYTAGAVRVTAWKGLPAGSDDAVRHGSPEAQRAFENTDDLLLTLGSDV